MTGDFEQGYKYKPKDVYPKGLEDAITDYYDSANHLRLAREVVKLFNQGDVESQERAIEGLLEAIDAHRMSWRRFDESQQQSTYIKPEAVIRGDHDLKFCPDCSKPLNRVVIASTAEACLDCGYCRT